ncbi:GDSL-type esterase/lipase family protein [bacterium]
MKNWLIIVLLFCFLTTAFTEDIRISCVGNSITQYKVEYPGLDLNSYPTQLGILLGEGYVVQNFGHHSKTMLKNGDVPYWDAQALTDALNSEPDIVTIMLGTNDSKPQNWIFKDEFKADYIAMIDTFRSLPSNPEIYVCLPAPATSSKYAISGDTIKNEMIPIIQEVIQEKNTHMIDFHTFFTNKEHLSYDGIHPTLEGCWQYALQFYDTLKSEEAPEVQMLTDVNLALNKPIITSQWDESLNNIADGSIHTIWYGANGEALTIDLGAVESMDHFQMIHQASVHYGYTIETSEDNTNWITVVDKSDNPDTLMVAVDSVDPVEARYVRFTLNCLDPDMSEIKLAEIKILETSPIHAPIMTYEVSKVTSKLAQFKLHVISSIEGGYIKYYYDTNIDGIYENGIGYRLQDSYMTTQSVRFDSDKYLYARFYKDGYEVTSDTIKFEYAVVSDVEVDTPSPNQFNLHQNYPNPFNPLTSIQYDLQKPGKVQLTIYDCLGRKISKPIDQFQNAGNHSFQFAADGLPSGQYVYTLEVDGQQVNKRMILIK